VDLLATFRGSARANPEQANEVIASYVTAGARIHLYSYLDKLQDKAFTVTLILSRIFSRGTNQGLLKQGNV
jgi:hypothetical protein